MQWELVFFIVVASEKDGVLVGGRLNKSNGGYFEAI